MRFEFADSPDTVFAAAVDVLRIIGKLKTNDKNTRKLVGQIKKGLDLAWEPVSVTVQIMVLPGRTALDVVAVQKQIDGLPDQRQEAIQVFSTHLKRRKDLTILD